jgi:hypothetical protein
VYADGTQQPNEFLTQASCFIRRTPRGINDVNGTPSPSPQPESVAYPSPSPLKPPFTPVPENAEERNAPAVDGYNGD